MQRGKEFCNKNETKYEQQSQYSGIPNFSSKREATYVVAAARLRFLVINFIRRSMQDVQKRQPVKNLSNRYAPLEHGRLVKQNHEPKNKSTYVFVCRHGASE